MTMATRQEVLGLYRRIFRLAKKWQAASGQMEDTIKEKQLFQKNKNVSRPRWRLQGGEQFLWCLFFSILQLKGLSSTNQRDRMWSEKGPEAQPSWLTQPLENRAQPGFLSSLSSSFSPAGKWLSILRRLREPGDLNQSSENFQSRISSSHTVPVFGHSHRKCSELCLVFSVHKLFRTSKYKPIQRKENRIKAKVPFITQL